ncbi:MAG: hypothetical protein AAF806_23080, partial [Bacteroidota bacterium]
YNRATQSLNLRDFLFSLISKLEVLGALMIWSQSICVIVLGIGSLILIVQDHFGYCGDTVFI